MFGPVDDMLDVLYPPEKRQDYVRAIGLLAGAVDPERFRVLLIIEIGEGPAEMKIHRSFFPDGAKVGERFRIRAWRHTYSLINIRKEWCAETLDGSAHVSISHPLDYASALDMEAR